MIGDPPVDAGALNDTVACAFPATAEGESGALGTVGGGDGVTELLATDAGPVPTLLVAVTVKVYAVPLAKPVTVNGLDAPDAVKPPGLDVAVYPVMVAPPLVAGALNDTVACAFPATADGESGADGTVAAAAGVTELLATDAALVPTELVAVTVKV